MIIQEYLSDINSAKKGNTSAEQLENILIITAERCLKIRTTRRNKRSYLRLNRKWFDKECRLKRHDLRNLLQYKKLLSTHIKEMNITTTINFQN